ncbi:MAG: DUF4115 domain-containing protein [Chloroflexota bacterium]
MDELGTLLREAREARGVTLADAQEATKINSRYLEALEDGSYDVLPSEVHVRGYLRNYARYLRLDPRPLLDRYELNRENRRTRPTEDEEDEDRAKELSALGPLDAPEEQVFFDPVNVDIGGSGRRSDSGSGLRIIIIVALLLSIAIVAIRFVPMLTGSNGGDENLSSGIEEMVSGLTNNDQEPTPEAASEQAGFPTPGSAITSTSRNAGIVLPTPTPTRPTLPATLETIQMRLDVTERTWMRVTIDGEVVFEGLARRGDEPYIWEADEEAQLLTGNAIGIFVTINDVALGKLGGRGEVVDETWTTTQSG